MHAQGEERGEEQAFQVPGDGLLQLQPRSPSPEGAQTRKRRRRLNAEELAVADGLLGLQEVCLLAKSVKILVSAQTGY